MNDLCADIGYKSINHIGEQLCGDHVDILEPDDDSSVVVLADGLGSGVKASILSTLTSKIISTMVAEGLSLTDCVETIAQTLPICSVRDSASPLAKPLPRDCQFPYPFSRESCTVPAAAFDPMITPVIALTV